jgi:hypothetical protein
VKLSLWSFIFAVLIACTVVIVSHQDFRQSQADAAPVATASLTKVAATAPSLLPADRAVPDPIPPLATAQEIMPAVHPDVSSSPALEQLVFKSPPELTGAGQLVHDEQRTGAKRVVNAARRRVGDMCLIALAGNIRPGCNTFFHTEVPFTESLEADHSTGLAVVEPPTHSVSLPNTQRLDDRFQRILAVGARVRLGPLFHL